MPWIAYLMEGINQGVLTVRLECNVNVDGGACGRGTEDLPVRRDGMPCMFHPDIVPM